MPERRYFDYPRWTPASAHDPLPRPHQCHPFVPDPHRYRWGRDGSLRLLPAIKAYKEQRATRAGRRVIKALRRQAREQRRRSEQVVA